MTSRIIVFSVIVSESVDRHSLALICSFLHFWHSYQKVGKKLKHFLKFYATIITYKDTKNKKTQQKGCGSMRNVPSLIMQQTLQVGKLKKTHLNCFSFWCAQAVVRNKNLAKLILLENKSSFNISIQVFL